MELLKGPGSVQEQPRMHSGDMLTRVRYGTVGTYYGTYLEILKIYIEKLFLTAGICINLSRLMFRRQIRRGSCSRRKCVTWCVCYWRSCAATDSHTSTSPSCTTKSAGRTSSRCVSGTFITWRAVFDSAFYIVLTCTVLPWVILHPDLASTVLHTNFILSFIIFVSSIVSVSIVSSTVSVCVTWVVGWDIWTGAETI